MSLALMASSGHDAALPPEQPCSLLRMAVGDDVLSVPIDDVREILQVARLTPLPRTPDFVRGVMNLRGAVVPVIDLAVRLGLPPTVMGRRSCIVVVNGPAAADADGDGLGGFSGPGAVLGLLVDAVFEVFDRSGHEIEPAPPMGTNVPALYLRGITRSEGRLIGVLSLNHVLAARELADCIAGYQPH
jgi:purine-binding chemotaxis protein CheW